MFGRFQLLISIIHILLHVISIYVSFRNECPKGSRPMQAAFWLGIDQILIGQSISNTQA